MLKFGSNGEGNGQFNAPTGVAVDSNGNIIVADWGNSRIQVDSNANVFVSSDWYLLKVKNCLSYQTKMSSIFHGLGHKIVDNLTRSADLRKVE